MLCQLLKRHQTKGCDPESRQRMLLCLKLVMQPEKLSFRQMEGLLLVHSRRILQLYLGAQGDLDQGSKEEEVRVV